MDIISIDEKTIKGASKDLAEESIHIVSACLCEEGISLGQVKVEDKSNEITAAPKLIKVLDIEGCIVTADGMGFQKKLVRDIVEKKASYVLAVKDNHKNLHQEIIGTTKMVRPSSIYKEIDADHGRVEERIYRVYRDLSFIRASWNWEQLTAIVEVERKRYNKKSGEESIEKKLFITNMARGKSAQIAQAIRSHWKVESMHWVLDVIFDEDSSRKRVRDLAENFSRLRKVVLALLRNYKKRRGEKKSLARLRKTAAWNTPVLEEMLFDAFAEPKEEL